MDTASGAISIASNSLLPSGNGGLLRACIIPLPEKNAFVVTGGLLYDMSK